MNVQSNLTIGEHAVSDQHHKDALHQGWQSAQHTGAEWDPVEVRRSGVRTWVFPVFSQAYQGVTPTVSGWPAWDPTSYPLTLKRKG